MGVLLPTTPQRCYFGLWSFDSELCGFRAAVRHYLLLYSMSVIKEALFLESLPYLSLLLLSSISQLHICTASFSVFLREHA